MENKDIQNLQQELEASENKYKAIFENFVDLYYRTDMKGIVTDVSPSCYHLTGWKVEEVIGHPATDLYINPEERKHLLEKLLKDGVIYGYEITLRHHDGRPVPVSVSSHIVKNEQGIPIYIEGTIRDITEKNKIEKDLRDNELFLESIIDNIPSMVFIKEIESFRFIKFNKAGEELLGYSKSEIIGKNDYDLFPKEQADFFIQKDREVISSNSPLDIPEEIIQTKHKGERILHTKKIPLSLGQGLPTFLLGISDDITEQKMAEDILKKKIDEIKRINDAMVGRELKMIELKKQIAELESKLQEKSL